MPPLPPIIFLDIDGVLATRRSIAASIGKRYWADGEWYPYKFDAEAVANLNSLTEQTDAMIVLSSTWRRGHTVAGLRGILAAEGVTGKLLSATPYLLDKENRREFERGIEIQWWMDNYHRYDGQPFVILDDDQDMAHLLPRLVCTSGDTGLTAADVEKAKQLLQEQPEVAA